ncbi:DUF192 domain-containing protein [Candidatus Daviesbacteria bacterium]|nr:DUF192 domain-containing protein [Candidatus Daviesbacteria bacterium]
MKKFIFQAILLLLVSGVAIFLFRAGPDISSLPFMPEKPVIRQLQINTVTLKVEVADTKDKRSKGLGGKERLAVDEGMLFIFPQPGEYPFWMKGLTFPLDFVWIRGDKVVDLTPNVQPPTSGQSDQSLPIYQSKESVDKVLEVNAGTIQRLDIKVGNTIKII